LQENGFAPDPGSGVGATLCRSGAPYRDSGREAITPNTGYMNHRLKFVSQAVDEDVHIVRALDQAG